MSTQQQEENENSSDEDVSDTAYFLNHAKSAHELLSWQRQVLLAAKRKRRNSQIVQPEHPFFAPPVPPTLNTAPVFNYSYDITSWKRPRKLIRIEDNTFRKPLKPEDVTFKKPPSPNVLKINLKIKTKDLSPERIESGKKEALSKLSKQPKFSKSRTPTFTFNDSTADSLDADSELLRLKQEYRLAQLKLKYIHLKKQLLKIPQS